MLLRLVLYASLVISWIACNNTSNDDQVRALTKSLEYSNRLLAEKSELEVEQLHDHLHDPQWAKKVAVWAPKADSCIRLSKEMLAELSSCKQQLKALSRSEKSPVQLSDDIYAKLYAKLIAWVDAYCHIVDTAEFVDYASFQRNFMKEMRENRKRTLEMLDMQVDSSLQVSIDARMWRNQIFKDASIPLTIAMLTKMENAVTIANDKFVNLCVNNSGPGCILVYQKFRVLTTLSSSYIKKGQKIELYAGVGEFSLASKPVFRVDGKKVEPDNEGVVTYTLLPEGKPGKHSIPVSIEFNTPDGRLTTLKKELVYIIAE